MIQIKKFYLSEPSSPGLVWVEHATTTAHVAEGGGARAGGTTTADTWDTGDGTTGTPGLGRSLLTGDGGDGVWLTVVLVQAGVDLGDNVGADWGLEDGWQVAGGTSGLAISSVN